MFGRAIFSASSDVDPIEHAKALLDKLPAEYALKLRTGMHLHTDGQLAERVSSSEPRQLKRWQRRRYARMKSAMRRLVNAPMGSGKSTLLVALALHDRNRGYKTIISYPQRTIESSFSRMKITLPGGNVEEWCPLVPPGVGRVNAIVDYVLSKRTNDVTCRALVCTHAAIVAAQKRLSELAAADPSIGDPWVGTSLFIDEVHHSLHDGDEDELVTNGLGEIVEHYLAREPGPLTFATATWVRSSNTIVQRDRLPRFVGDPYHIDEYLETLEHLRDVRIKFAVAPQMKAFSALIADDPKRPTITYLPLGLKPSEKRALLRRCLAITKKHKLTVCDLVTDDDERDERRVALMKAIKAGKGPDMVLALNMFREGADWPAAQRAILLAPRGSVLDTLQILGRLLRDYPNKREAEFVVVLPSRQDGVVEPAKVRDYLKVILASLVVDWHFRRVSLGAKRSATRKKTRDVADGLEESLELADTVTGLLLRTDTGDGVDAALQALAAERSELRDPQERKRVAEAFASWGNTAAQLFRDADDVPCEPDLVEGWTGIVKTLVATCGYASLRDLRQALGQRENYATFDAAKRYARSCGARTVQAWRALVLPAEIPMAPDVVYRELGWTSWGDFLGTESVASRKRSWRIFRAARAYARSLKLKSEACWLRVKLPCDIPRAPYEVYALDGWISWGDWLGTGRVAYSKRKLREFESARAYARSLKIGGSVAWNKAVLPADIPRCPNVVYAKNGWLNWADWFGVPDRTKRPFVRARAYARSLGLASVAAWRKVPLPPNIPRCPDRTYRGRGWIDWNDWLGKR